MAGACCQILKLIATAYIHTFASFKPIILTITSLILGQYYSQINFHTATSTS